MIVRKCNQTIPRKNQKLLSLTLLILLCKVVWETIKQKKSSSRENRGGIAIECNEALKPVWVREGLDNVKALSIDIFVKNLQIRYCIGYGGQENDLIENKTAFWEYFDNKVLEAKKIGAGLKYKWIEIFGQEMI